MLALQYHPDRNEDSELAVIRFREIQEAYNALSNENLRTIYNREWRKQFPDTPLSKVKELSAVSIVEESKALAEYIKKADIYRFNKDYVYIRLTDILSEENIAFLLHTADEQKNTEIIQLSLDAALKLPWKKIDMILPTLLQLAEKSKVPVSDIIKWKKKNRLHIFWERNYPWAALLIALLICFVIFGLSR